MKSSHPKKKKPEEIARDPVREIELSPEDWEEFERGATLFNTGKFWHAHEAWELVWLRHTEDERLFFQGIIQLAAAYHQLFGKKSFRGMMNNFDKAYAKLEVFAPNYLGVHVDQLLLLIDQGKEEAERLGDRGVGQFNPKFVPKLHVHKPGNPDLLVQIRGIVRSDRFDEGVKLFNEGYHWEAHEVWEEIWRGEEGDAKAFAHAFVELASGYSFLKRSKASNAKYLMEKAVVKFEQFERIACDLALDKIINETKAVLVHLEGVADGESFRVQLQHRPAISFITKQQPSVS